MCAYLLRAFVCIYEHHWLFIHLTFNFDVCIFFFQTVDIFSESMTLDKRSESYTRTCWFPDDIDTKLLGHWKHFAIKGKYYLRDYAEWWWQGNNNVSIAWPYTRCDGCSYSSSVYLLYKPVLWHEQKFSDKLCIAIYDQRWIQIRWYDNVQAQCDD